MTGQAHTLILGLETSCDETAAAVVARRPDGSGAILSNVVRSQIAEHAPYGGVVPELAARAHVVHLDHIIAEALTRADVSLSQIDAIAATAGPGLIGGVLVGLTTAKAIAAATNKPLLAINHLEAHALTARLTDAVQFPYLMLLVSGGHTQFVAVHELGHYERWGTTIDDALGEAFDKVAKMLALGYPGGPEVERWAQKGDPARFSFPRPLLRQDRLDFSFSGLKTAVRQQAEAIAPLGESDIADICAGFQAAVLQILGTRTRAALDQFDTRFAPLDLKRPAHLVVAGGVAANKAIRAELDKITGEAGARLVVPPPTLCTDNGAMVAWAGAERFAAGDRSSFQFAARPRWPLDDAAMPLATPSTTRAQR